jgi:hypothetical protein
VAVARAAEESLFAGLDERDIAELRRCLETIQANVATRAGG